MPISYVIVYDTRYHQMPHRAADVAPRLALPCGASALWNQAIECLSSSSNVLVAMVQEDCRRRVAAILSTENYAVIEAGTSAELGRAIEGRSVDLAILDSEIPGVFEICHRLKLRETGEHVPVLMLLHEEEPAWQIRAIEAGVDDLLCRAFHPDVLTSRLRSMLRHKLAIDQLEQSESILFALAQAIEKRDHTTGGHCERLSTIAVALGMSVSLPRRSLVALYRGGYLHDIGKVAIPDSILFKPGPLDQAEWQVMMTHTMKGEEICRSLKSLASVLPIIRSHHERWDGSGYPDGLRGADIPLPARILQLADIYDALTSERPYKRALSPEEAIALMRTETGHGWRDPDLMEAFAELHRSKLLGAAAGRVSEWSGLDSLRTSLYNLGRQLAAAAGTGRIGSDTVTPHG